MTTHVHLSACTVKFSELDKVWTECVAVISSPGASDVITFILPNGEAYIEDNVWEYSLWPYKGAISIPVSDPT